MAKVTRYEYMKNELDHAAKLSRTLPELVDRNVFDDHAIRLKSRLDMMTPSDAGKLVDDDGAEDPIAQGPAIARKIRITIVESFTIETSEHTVNTLRCDDALGGQLARKLALTVGKKDHEFSRVIVKDTRR